MQNLTVEFAEKSLCELSASYLRALRLDYNNTRNFRKKLFKIFHKMFD
jgi:hypothetical protein